MSREEMLVKREVFDFAYKVVSASSETNKEFIYEIYCLLIPEIEELNKKITQDQFNIINPLILINYIISEHDYSMTGLNREDRAIMEKNENYVSRLGSIIFDKYYTNERLGYVTTPTESKYYPPISSLTLYLNFILTSLNGFKKGEPKETLLTDMLSKAFTMAKCIISLLTQGFETEAFSTWRTFHEAECITKILADNQELAVEAYLRHMDYGFAFRDTYEDKEAQDRIFAEIKENMRKHDLKSKDMKKYIEYGWLYEVKGIENIKDFKLNFRDGVEEAAGLSQYSKWYEMSSELAHSSPLLIYSNKKFFFDLTLVATLESFLRMEGIFNKIYSLAVNEQLRENYKTMRDVYRTQLLIILDLENSRFKKEHMLKG